MLFKKKNNVEVVPESEYTDFGDQYATKKHLAIAMCVPTVAGAGMLAHRLLSDYEKATEEIANTVIDSATLQPVSSSISQTPSTPDTITAMSTGAVTDHVAGASLDVLTAIMDPIIDILVALALPVASLMMVGACFFIMLNQKEKAYSIIFNSAIGYVLIQMSPLLLNILKNAGDAVQPT